MRKTLATVLWIAIQSGPSARGKLLKCFFEPGSGRDLIARQFRSDLVAASIKRVQNPGRKFSRFLQYRIQKVGRHFFAARQCRNLSEPHKFVDNEFHIANRCGVDRHRSLLILQKAQGLRRWIIAPAGLAVTWHYSLKPLAGVPRKKTGNGLQFHPATATSFPDPIGFDQHWV